MMTLLMLSFSPFLMAATHGENGQIPRSEQPEHCRLLLHAALDVEGEINGLYDYGRKLKFNRDHLKKYFGRRLQLRRIDFVIAKKNHVCSP
jgi:hypothetical protein